MERLLQLFDEKKKYELSLKQVYDDYRQYEFGCKFLTYNSHDRNSYEEEVEYFNYRLIVNELRHSEEKICDITKKIKQNNSNIEKIKDIIIINLLLCEILHPCISQIITPYLI